jgi:hypothetical protein
MRGGSVYRRCNRKTCRARVDAGARTCPACGGKSFSWTFVVDLSESGEGRKQHK